MLCRLAHEVEQAGGLIMLNCDVSEIRIDSKERQVALAFRGGTLSARRVVISSRAHAPIIYDDKIVQVEARETRTFSVVLYLKGNKLRKFGYVEFIADPVIRRVRDVGIFVDPPLQRDHILLCVQVRRNSCTFDEVSQVLKRLVASKLISANVELLGLHLDVVCLRTIEDEPLENLTELCSPYIVAIKTTDLVDELRSSLMSTGQILSLDQFR